MPIYQIQNRPLSPKGWRRSASWLNMRTVKNASGAGLIEVQSAARKNIRRSAIVVRKRWRFNYRAQDISSISSLDNHRFNHYDSRPDREALHSTNYAAS